MKIFSKAIIAMTLALAFVGCDSLYDATSVAINAKETAEKAAADAKIADLDTSLPFKVISWTDKNGTALTTAVETTMTIDGTDILTNVVNISGTGVEKDVAFGAVTFDFATLNGSTTNYTAGQVINLGSDYSLVITSKDGTVQKTYTVTVNLVNVPATLYLTGDAGTGWGNDQALVKQGTRFSAVLYLNVGGFKLRPNQAWDGNEFGKDGDLLSETTGNGTTHYYAKGTENVPIATAGPYLIEFDYASEEMVVEPVVSIGIIGDMNGWGAQVPLTRGAASSNVWSGSVTFGATDGFLIRINDNWDWAVGSDAAADKGVPATSFGVLNGTKKNFGAANHGGAGTRTVTFNGLTFEYGL